MVDGGLHGVGHGLRGDGERGRGGLQAVGGGAHRGRRGGKRGAAYVDAESERITQLRRVDPQMTPGDAVILNVEF